MYYIEFKGTVFMNYDPTRNPFDKAPLLNNGPQQLYDHVSQIPKKMTLMFFISKGVLAVSNAPSGSYEIKATSGKDQYMNNPNTTNVQNYGAIPKGEYYLYPSEFADPNLIRDLYRNVVQQLDWGDWLIKLHPEAHTNTYGRSGFHLHCGSYPGSAGCIDIGGGIRGNNITETLKSDILKSNQNKIKLNIVE